MKEGFIQLEMQLFNDCLMLTDSSMSENHNPITSSATIAFLAPSKEMLSTDKSPKCTLPTRKPKVSKTSADNR